MYPQPEPSGDDEQRARGACILSDSILCEKLLAATRPGTFERAFLLRDPAHFDLADRKLLRSLAWFYRDRLPRWLRPKRNPDDPIVRESMLTDG